MNKELYKIVEMVLSYLLAAAMFGTFICLVAFKDFQWPWIPVGIFCSFLILGFTKIDMKEIETPKKEMK